MVLAVAPGRAAGAHGSVGSLPWLRVACSALLSLDLVQPDLYAAADRSWCVSLRATDAFVQVYAVDRAALDAAVGALVLLLPNDILLSHTWAWGLCSHGQRAPCDLLNRGAPASSCRGIATAAMGGGALVFPDAHSKRSAA